MTERPLYPWFWISISLPKLSALNKQLAVDINKIALSTLYQQRTEGKHQEQKSLIKYVVNHTPFIATAAGPLDQARYAGVMEDVDVGGYTILSTIKDDDYTFKFRDNEARTKGQKLIWLDAYGAPGDPYICAIWHNNPNIDKQYWYIKQNQASAMKNIQTQISKPGWRPSSIAATVDGSIATLFEDTLLVIGLSVLDGGIMNG